MPPRIPSFAETAHKVAYRIKQRLRGKLNRWRADPARAELSARAFLQALDGSFDSVDAFLAHIRDRDTPRFFVAPAQRDRVATLAREYFPASVDRAVSVADQACDHVFDLLGSGPVRLGEKIDWHADFKAGWRWEPAYYTEVRYLDLEQPYDVKVPWELSRFHHAVTQGQAYWYTGHVRLLKGLLAHGRHIFSNLEWGLTTHNHYLSNLVGLIYLGVMFPEFREADRWLAWGLRGLEREIDVQVYPDGVDYEGSISYHRLVTELFLSAVSLCRLNGIDVSSRILSRLEKMLAFVAAYTQPDGTAPIIGDADDGRLHKLSPPDLSYEFVDHRHLLGIGAVLFGRDDLAQATAGAWEDAFWLSGGEMVPLGDVTSNQISSQSFSDGGVYIMRQENVHLTINAGGNGMGGVGGHAHNNALGLTFYAYDKAFLVDPGTYVYTADYRWRNHFRATAAHNVVVVDGEEMQRFAGRELFRLCEDARPRVLAWRTSPESDWFDGGHYGYTRLPMPVRHRRQVYFDKKQGFCIVRDLLTGQGRHAFDLYFHFAPLPVDEWPDAGSPAVRTLCPDGANLALVPLKADGLSVRVFEDWVSPSYGRKLAAPVACFSKEASVPAEFITVLFPLPAGVEIAPSEIQELALRVWETCDDLCDG
jgi:hypothetical protein